ncbi:transglutaminaseTgpA domain-containing protein [Glaciibacter superstes]|uniref:transglutaminase family protein n=1 Tax=Glaciibacter superstes TaxID=501023 RepID=UPI0003B7AB3A|nr:transglutaminase domain-containing protein [Glaciibacter superstes]
MKDLRPFPRRAVWDVVVLSVLSLLGVLGFETSFGAYNFLLAGLGGLLVGTAAAILGYSLRLSALMTVLVGLLAYFLIGTPFTMGGEGIFVVLPSLATLAGLALGAVFGWADIVTLSTPVEAPYYMPVLPYFAAWLVALVGTMLASRWLPSRKRTVWRSSILLIGPVLLYLAGILMGTDEPYFAGIRGVAFAVIALVWLGWRRTQIEQAGSPSSNRLLRRKLIGTASLVAGAILVGSLAGAALAPTAHNRFVLREEIQPPFDPLQFPSPLAGFRKYTKTLADTPLFTVEGLKTGDVVRLASMDSYNGKLWNVAGPKSQTDGSGSFRLVGRTLPETKLVTSSETRTVTVSVEGYSDAWLPGVGYPTTIEFDDKASQEQAESLRYNAGTGTAVLTGGVKDGYSYTVDAELQRSFKDEDLADVPVADIAMPPVENIPDVVVAKGVELVGDAESPIDQLRAIEQGLKTQGFLSHGLASDGVPSRAGHGADRIDELFTRSQMVGDQEQYAAAMALMARNMGFPARVVMGFAPEVPEDAKSVEVVGDDVTAWVEVAFQGTGWVAFNPTPEQTDVPQDQTPKPRTVPQPQVRQPPRSDNQNDDLLTAVEIDDSDKDDNDGAFVLPAWAWVVLGVVGIPALLFFGPILVIGALKARRRRRRRNQGTGDKRVAGSWDELTDGYAELGFDVPRAATRRQVASHLEAQLAEQHFGDRPVVRTDTGPVAVVGAGAGVQEADAQGATQTMVRPRRAERRPGPAVAGGDAPATSIRLVPLAAEVDRAVFNGEDIDDERVQQSWDAALESLDVAETAAGRTRRLISRFRLRSARDWSKVDLSR